MAIPPPPPAPGPPPPPIGNLKLGPPVFGESAGGDASRSALLLSIQKGAKLKKTTTIDKSGPSGAGRVADINNSSSNARMNLSGAPTRPPPPNNGNSAQINGTPKLKGIFEGMSSMPKLKPVGGRTIGMTSPTNESPSSTSTGSGSPQNLNGSAVDFSTELSQRIAMKKQMKSPASNTISEINSRNRGPPPQPPSKIVTDNNNSSTAVSNSPLIKQSNSGSPTTVSSNGSNITSILPNKSSLFGNSNSTKTTTPPPPPPPITTVAMVSTITTNKVVPNYGKPTCAPKPPVTAKNGLSPLNNSSNTTNNGNSSNRSIVSRAQSMRAPRSPPISVAGSTFPATQQFGTIRGIPAAFQSQDAINAIMRPAPTISRPTVAPPRPPIEAKLAAAANVKEQSPRTVPSEKRSQGRCKSPPPPPIRSISNTNLPTLPLSIPPSAISTNLSNISNSSSNNFGGSASNVSTLINNVMLTTNTGSANNLSVTKDRSPNNSLNNIAPPLPPHRTCPAPPPPVRQTSITPINNIGGAPPVPQRHSSMRYSNGSQVTTVVQQQTIATSVTSNSTRTVVNRFVMDLEAKFGHSFHNVTEFPAPQPFTKFEKSYPSRKATTENRKAKAPSPPSMKTGITATPSNEKYQLQLTQDDNSSYC